jgi:hypothetical protein
MLLLLLFCGTGAIFWALSRVKPATPDPTYLKTWDPAKAAAYLDSREVWWQTWPPSQQHGGTFCVSCHTALPYAWARPKLRQAAGETDPAAPEKFLTDSIEKRVANWAEMPPYYSDYVGPGKAAQSRATEAILNAVILVSEDTRQNHLRPISRTALNNAWTLQETSGPVAGGWKWQDFQLAPWESAESAYQGAALLAEKVEAAPDGYANEAEARSHLNQIWEYLDRDYASQTVLNQLYVLWASSKSPRPLTPEQRDALLQALRNLQQNDGGWSLASLDAAHNIDIWKGIRHRLKLALRPPPSDGCATGLVVVVLQHSGIDRQDPMLRRGVDWLKQHQTSDGSWRAESLNAKRNLQTGVGRFMSDAATGFAVMALEEAQ